jgi:hypothetical protein
MAWNDAPPTKEELAWMDAPPSAEEMGGSSTPWSARIKGAAYGASKIPFTDIAMAPRIEAGAKTLAYPLVKGTFEGMGDEYSRNLAKAEEYWKGEPSTSQPEAYGTAETIGEIGGPGGTAAVKLGGKLVKGTGKLAESVMGATPTKKAIEWGRKATLDTLSAGKEGMISKVTEILGSKAHGKDVTDKAMELVDFARKNGAVLANPQKGTQRAKELVTQFGEDIANQLDEIPGEVEVFSVFSKVADDLPAGAKKAEKTLEKIFLELEGQGEKTSIKNLWEFRKKIDDEINWSALKKKLATGRPLTEVEEALYDARGTVQKIISEEVAARGGSFPTMAANYQKSIALEALAPRREIAALKFKGPTEMLQGMGKTGVKAGARVAEAGAKVASSRPVAGAANLSVRGAQALPFYRQTEE